MSDVPSPSKTEFLPEFPPWRSVRRHATRAKLRTDAMPCSGPCFYRRPEPDPRLPRRPSEPDSWVRTKPPQRRRGRWRDAGVSWRQVCALHSQLPTRPPEPTRGRPQRGSANEPKTAAAPFPARCRRLDVEPIAPASRCVSPVLPSNDRDVFGPALQSHRVILRSRAREDRKPRAASSPGADYLSPKAQPLFFTLSYSVQLMLMVFPCACGAPHRSLGPRHGGICCRVAGLRARQSSRAASAASQTAASGWFSLTADNSHRLTT
jgi:hypothetical protein